MKPLTILSLCHVLVLIPALVGAEAQDQLRVRVSWGHQAPTATGYWITLVPSGVTISDPAGDSLESDEGLRDGAWRTRAGGGDVDGVQFTLGFPTAPIRTLTNLNNIWADLIAQSDADTARRLRLDPAFRPDRRRLTIAMNEEGTKGFTVTVDQLIQHKVLWAPSLDVFLSAGDPPVSFAEHQKQLGPWKGKRILDQVHHEPEATYEQYKNRWEDMGNPAYVHRAQPAPGHIVCLAWDSAIPKFGIDRGAGVWSDLGNPDRFRFWFDFGDLSKGIAKSWRSQRLTDGLPVITTTLEKDGIRCEVEQFAYPLNGPPPERRGDIAVVLLQKVRLTELQGRAQTVAVVRTHARRVPPGSALEIVTQRQGSALLIQESGKGGVLFSIEGVDGNVELSATGDFQKDMKKFDVSLSVALPAKGSREWVVKLPSPVVAPRDCERLVALNYDSARGVALRFWTEYLSRGAQFRAPETAVNDLFRANLWHALRLPRRHGGSEQNVAIDLPYSNFAYTQTGTPWPVNEAVYVDYMLYDLRGYHNIAAEELAVMYRNNQEPNGHLKGNANWVVNTPAMLYAVAKNYLLSGDRKGLDRLMPTSLKAMDWCLDQIQQGSQRAGPTNGLVAGHLNDGTGEGLWAFNQAYVYAGLDLFGRVLQEIGHPRARECLDAARAIQRSIDMGFRAASVRSPLVQLRDHTWIPYVPCEAATPGRLFSQWYPTDVDTGAVHLLRLKAIPAHSDLADALLNDHEDNLYLHGWGMANEPVYNQQATAYLLRDDPEAAIRAFYSYVACAFSHSVFEPVEHRWTHGQYFGPPSTDGAWFELYRNMLIHEMDNDALFLGQATPRAWLADGKKIEVERAPTYYGNMSMTIESRTDANRILAELQMPDRHAPKVLLLRLRHPQRKPLKTVTVNGSDWSDFDVGQEWIRIANPRENRYSITALY